MSYVTETVLWIIFLCALFWTTAATSNTTAPMASVSPPATSPHCIRSVQDLILAFKERKTWSLNASEFQEDSLFDFSIEFSLTYLSYAVYYSYPKPGQSDQRPESGKCCILPDTDSSTSNCRAFVNHHKNVYQVLPGALVFLFGSPIYVILGPSIFQQTMAMAMRRFCWSIPVFCEEVSPTLSEAMLADFTLVVPNLVRDAPALLDTDVGFGFIEDFFHPRWNGELTDVALTRMRPAIFLYVLSVGVPIAVLPLIIKAITKYGRRVSFSMKHYSVANVAITTVMLHSWVWALSLYGVHIAVINLYERHLLSDPSHLPEYTMPHTFYGLYSFVSLGVVIVLEFPFLVWIIIKSPLMYTKCPTGPLCMISWVLRTLGWIGVVYFLQIITNFAVFFTLFLFTSPLSAITSMCLSVLLILSCGTATGAVITIMVRCVTANNKRKRALRSLWMLFYLAAIFVSNFMVGGLLFALLSNKDAPTFNPRVILSSILASGLVGASLYALKIMVLKQFFMEASDLNHMEKVAYTDE